MKDCIPCTVAFYQEVCRIFFLRKVFEVRETGNPEVPLYFGEGLRRSLGNAAGCAGKLQETVENRGAWRAVVHEMAKSRTRLSN